MLRFTPLHLALANGWKETALSLMHNGASSIIRSKENLTAAEYAASRGYQSLATDFEKEAALFETIRRWQQKNEQFHK